MKTKLFILYSILIITLSTSLAFILPVILENEIIDEVKLSSIIITRMTAINIAPAMHFNDDEALIEALDATYINKQLEYIVIESRDEKIIYSDIKSDLNKSDYKIGQKLEISPKGMIIKTSEVIFIDDIELGKLYIGFSMVDHKQQILKFQQMIIAMSAAILFVGLITSWLISNFFVKPLAEITKVMKSIGDHNLSERVELHTNDEIGELAASFNNMVDKLEKAVEKTKELNLSLSEKADELSETVATKDKFFSIIAHDLRGPLGGFRNVTRLLQNSAYEFSMDEVKQFIEILKDSSD
ncbi:MAG: HAMP domain-containing protein [Candidatus Kapaibacterium sp.]